MSRLHKVKQLDFFVWWSVSGKLVPATLQNAEEESLNA